MVVRKRKFEGASIAGWKQKGLTNQMQKRPARSSPELHLLDTLLKPIAVSYREY